MLKVIEGAKSLDRKMLGGMCAGVVVIFVIFFLMSSHDQGTVDPLVGSDKWSAGVIRQTGLGVYRVWASADFKGGDIGFVEAKTIDECLYACDDHKECVYVAYADKLCYLKDAPTLFETFTKRPKLFAAKRIRNRPLVSETWHDAKVVDTTKSSFRVWENYEFEGGDASTVLQANLDGCLHSCETDPDCMFVSFDGRECHVKKDSTRVKKTEKQGMTAAMKVRMKDAPDPLVKHHWAKGGQKQTEHAVYQTWAGCHFKGHDILSVTATSLNECLMECDKELFCKHVTLIDKECKLQGWSPEYFEVLPAGDSTQVWAAQQIELKHKATEHRSPHTGYPTNPDEAQDLHGDHLVGEFYDEGDEYETKFFRYRMWKGMDFQGGDLHANSMTLDSYTLESCLEACDHRPECGFAIVMVGKECWLKGHPYEMTRMIDPRVEVYSVMKLSRVGKSGLDAKTIPRTNRGYIDPTTSGMYFPMPAFPDQESRTSIMGNLSTFAMYGFVVVGLFGAAAMYYDKQMRTWHRRELE